MRASSARLSSLGRKKIWHMLKLDAVIKLLLVLIGHEIYLQQFQ